MVNRWWLAGLLAALGCGRAGALGATSTPLNGTKSSTASSDPVQRSPLAAGGESGQSVPGANAEGPASAEGEPDRPRLPPTVIQAVVRGSYDKFRSCYEAGLGRDRGLQGRVTVRFVIGEDGKVNHSEAADEQTMSDHEVTACVVRAFMKLVFPTPEKGIVTVVYPIVFSPDP